MAQRGPRGYRTPLIYALGVKIMKKIEVKCTSSVQCDAVRSLEGRMNISFEFCTALLDLSVLIYFGSS